MGAPRYIQIHNEIRRNIEDGTWPVGSRIPSERGLAEQFNVSRMTLRQSIQTLVDEGILDRQVGSGTYVANRKVQEKMSGVTSFTDLMIAAGKVPSSTVVTYRTTAPSRSEADHLKLAEGERVLRMERIRYADGVPICFEVATIPKTIVEGLSRSEVSKSLYAALEEKKELVIGKAQQNVSAILAAERIAEMLSIKRGEAILQVRQVTELKDGKPFEYVRAQYVGERFEFYLEK